MNLGKYNIPFYREEKYRDMCFALKERMDRQLVEGRFNGIALTTCRRHAVSLVKHWSYPWFATRAGQRVTAQQGAYVGAVDRSRGACKATTRDGVPTALVVKNADEMYKRLCDKDIEFDRLPKYSEALKIGSTVFTDPEGYKFEVEQFLSAADRKVLCGESE